MPYLSAWEKEGQLLEQNDVAKRYSNKQNDISLSDLPIRIKESVSSSYANLEDTPAVKKGLKTLGYYQSHDGDLTQYPDAELFKGIRSFQKDNNLYADGKMLPNGPTLNTLNIRLGEQLGKQLGSSIADGIDLVKGYKDNQSPFLIKNWFSSSDTTKNSAEQSDATGNDLKQPDISVLQSDESEQDTEMTSKAFSHTGLSSVDLTNVSPTKTSSVSQNDSFAIIECPSIKTEYMKSNDQEEKFATFQQALLNHPDYNEKMSKMASTTYALEGFNVHPKNPNITAVAGITKRTFEDYKNRNIGNIKSVLGEKTNANLTADQQAEFYKVHIDYSLPVSGGGFKMLSGDHFNDRVSMSLYDVAFHEGRIGTGKMIREAIQMSGGELPNEKTSVYNDTVHKELTRLLSDGKEDVFLKNLETLRNNKNGDSKRNAYILDYGKSSSQ